MSNKLSLNSSNNGINPAGAVQPAGSPPLCDSVSSNDATYLQTSQAASQVALNALSAPQPVSPTSLLFSNSQGNQPTTPSILDWDREDPFFDSNPFQDPGLVPTNQSLFDNDDFLFPQTNSASIPQLSHSTFETQSAFSHPLTSGAGPVSASSSSSSSSVTFQDLWPNGLRAKKVTGTEERIIQDFHNNRNGKWFYLERKKGPSQELAQINDVLLVLKKGEKVLLRMNDGSYLLSEVENVFKGRFHSAFYKLSIKNEANIATDPIRFNILPLPNENALSRLGYTQINKGGSIVYEKKSNTPTTLLDLLSTTNALDKLWTEAEMLKNGGVPSSSSSSPALLPPPHQLSSLPLPNSLGPFPAAVRASGPAPQPPAFVSNAGSSASFIFDPLTNSFFDPEIISEMRAASSSSGEQPSSSPSAANSSSSDEAKTRSKKKNRTSKPSSQPVINPIFPTEVYNVLFSIKDRPVKYDSNSKGYINEPPFIDESGRKILKVTTLFGSSVLDKVYSEVRPDYQETQYLLVFNEKDSRFYIGFFKKGDGANKCFKIFGLNDLIKISTRQNKSGILLEKIFPISQDTVNILAQAGYHLIEGKNGEEYYDFSKPPAAAASSSSGPDPQQPATISKILKKPPSRAFNKKSPGPLPQSKTLLRTQPSFEEQVNITRPKIPDRVFEILFSNQRDIVYGDHCTPGTIGLPLLDTTTNTVSFSVKLNSRSDFTKDVSYELVRPRFKTDQRVLVFDDDDKRFYIGYYLKLEKGYHVISKNTDRLEITVNQRSSGILIEKIIPFPPGTENKLAKLNYHLQEEQGKQYYDFSNLSAADSSSSSSQPAAHSGKRKRPTSLGVPSPQPQTASIGEDREYSLLHTHDLSSPSPSALLPTPQMLAAFAKPNQSQDSQFAFQGHQHYNFSNSTQAFPSFSSSGPSASAGAHSSNVQFTDLWPKGIRALIRIISGDVVTAEVRTILNPPFSDPQGKWLTIDDIAHQKQVVPFANVTPCFKMNDEVLVKIHDCYYLGTIENETYDRATKKSDYSIRLGIDRRALSKDLPNFAILPLPKEDALSQLGFTKYVEMGLTKYKRSPFLDLFLSSDMTASNSSSSSTIPSLQQLSASPQTCSLTLPTASLVYDQASTQPPPALFDQFSSFTSFNAPAPSQDYAAAGQFSQLQDFSNPLASASVSSSSGPSARVQPAIVFAAAPSPQPQAAFSGTFPPPSTSFNAPAPSQDYDAAGQFSLFQDFSNPFASASAFSSSGPSARVQPANVFTAPPPPQPQAAFSGTFPPPSTSFNAPASSQDYDAAGQFSLFQDFSNPLASASVSSSSGPSARVQPANVFAAPPSSQMQAAFSGTFHPPSSSFDPLALSQDYGPPGPASQHLTASLGAGNHFSSPFDTQVPLHAYHATGPAPQALTHSFGALPQPLASFDMQVPSPACNVPSTNAASMEPDVFNLLFQLKRDVVYDNSKSPGYIQNSLPTIINGKQKLQVFTISDFRIIPYEDVSPRFNRGNRVLFFNEADNRFYIGYYNVLTSSYHSIFRKQNMTDEIQIFTPKFTSGNLLEKIFSFPPQTEDKITELGYDLKTDVDGNQYYNFF